MMSSNGTDKAVEAVNEEEAEEVTRRAVVVVDALERGVAPPKMELEDCFSSVEVVAAVVVSVVLMEVVVLVSVDLFFNFNFIRAGRAEAAPIDVVLAVVLLAAAVSPSNPPHLDDDDGVAANLDVNEEEEEEDGGGGANRPVLTLLANFFVGILRDVFDQAAVPPLLAAVAAVAAAFILCLPSKFGNSALLSIYGVLPSLDTTNHCASLPLAAA